ncbi:MAG: alpha/beta hydrolase fold domain-containing protein [Lachnospiraceae bacterium]
MKRKIISVLMVAAMALSLLSGCGDKTPEAGEETVDVPETEAASDISAVAGTYSFEESAMGGAFTVPWTLVLKEDGTYTLTEENPFMGVLEHKGTYTYDGEIVTTGPFEEGDSAQAEFLNEDFSCEWTVDMENSTCVPLNMGEASEGGMPEGGIPGGGIPEGGIPNGEIPNGGAASGEATYSAVAYASTSAAQICDIYLPEGEGPFPTIIVFHGGGFMFGDQGMDIIKPIISAGVANGYAVVSADYRKSSEAVFPAAVADAKAVVRFVKANAAEYGFDAEHIAVWGESAGAYLALMTALTPNVAELNGDVADYEEQDSSVTALVSFYAPVEFYTMDDEFAGLGVEGEAHNTGSFECKFIGVDDLKADEATTNKTWWSTYSEQVPADLVAWIQAGTGDTRVPFTQSENLANGIQPLIKDVQYSTIEGANHEDNAFYTEENLAGVFAFLDGVMK